MRDLLEKILRNDESFRDREVDWGVIDPSGRVNNKIVNHYSHAKEYFKKHRISLKGSCSEVVAKFLSLTKNIRYTMDKLASSDSDEINFAIVSSVSPAQIRAIRRLSRNKDVVYDITDEQGHTIEYGLGMQELLASLKHENLLEKVNELDFKKGLRTAAVAGLIAAAPAGLGYRKGVSQRPVEKPVATAAAEIPAKAEISKDEYQVVRMRVTAYCPCEKCCGSDSPGVTASGHSIETNDAFVAADKRYSYGTEMVIPGYNDSQPVEVLDRGGAIQGDRIDVFFPTHEEALEWGVKNLDVKVYTE